MLCSKCHEAGEALTEDGLCPDCRIDEERRIEIIDLARERLQREGELEIDDDARVSEGDDNGCYISAWAWLEFSDTKFNKEKEDQSI